MPSTSPSPHPSLSTTNLHPYSSFCPPHFPPAPANVGWSFGDEDFENIDLVGSLFAALILASLLTVSFMLCRFVYCLQHALQSVNSTPAPEPAPTSNSARSKGPIQLRVGMAAAAAISRSATDMQVGGRLVDVSKVDEAIRLKNIIFDLAVSAAECEDKMSRSVLNDKR